MSKAKNTNNTKNEMIFYKVALDDENKIKKIIINQTKWINILYSFGFRRFDLDSGGFIFIKVDNHIISEVSITQIQDTFIYYLKNLQTDGLTPYLKEALIETFFLGIGKYFNETKLSLLKHDEEFIFNKDTKDEAFVYFKNGVVRVTKENWEILDYKHLKGYVWKNQIIDKDFKKIEMLKHNNYEMPVFGRFMDNISGNQDRFDSLCSIMGYNMHSFFETKLRATILTDSKISDEAEGRTGKTLLAKALGYIRVYVELSGKNFVFTNKHKYDKCSLDTQILHINDVQKYFPFEMLYNDITEGITIDKKNQEPIFIKTKMIISTNQTIKIDGSSSRDRCIEFELADKYNDKFQPKDDFGHWFFTEWDETEWNGFYNFMMYCVWVYFNQGLIMPPEINLKERKLLDETCQEFCEFIKAKEIEPDVRYCRDEWHEDFLNSYKDLAEDKFKKQVKTFTKWLKSFAKYSNKFKPLTSEDLSRSNNKNFIVFKLK